MQPLQNESNVAETQNSKYTEKHLLRCLTAERRSLQYDRKHCGCAQQPAVFFFFLRNLNYNDPIFVKKIKKRYCF